MSKENQGAIENIFEAIVTSATTKSSYKVILQKLMQKGIIIYEIFCLVILAINKMKSLQQSLLSVKTSGCCPPIF